MQGSAALPRLLVQVPAGRRGGRGQRVTGRRPRLPGLPRQGADVSRRAARPPAPLGVAPSSCAAGGPAPAPLRGWRGAPLTEAARELTATAEQAKEAAGQLCAPGQGPRGHRLPVALDHRVPATPPCTPQCPEAAGSPRDSPALSHRRTARFPILWTLSAEQAKAPAGLAQRLSVAL